MEPVEKKPRPNERWPPDAEKPRTLDATGRFLSFEKDVLLASSDAMDAGIRICCCGGPVDGPAGKSCTSHDILPRDRGPASILGLVIPALKAPYHQSLDKAEGTRREELKSDGRAAGQVCTGGYPLSLSWSDHGPAPPSSKVYPMDSKQDHDDTWWDNDFPEDFLESESPQPTQDDWSCSRSVSSGSCESPPILTFVEDIRIGLISPEPTERAPTPKAVRKLSESVGMAEDDVPAIKDTVSYSASNSTYDVELFFQLKCEEWNRAIPGISTGNSAGNTLVPALDCRPNANVFGEGHISEYDRYDAEAVRRISNIGVADRIVDDNVRALWDAAESGAINVGALGLEEIQDLFEVIMEPERLMTTSADDRNSANFGNCGIPLKASKSSTYTSSFPPSGRSSQPHPDTAFLVNPVQVKGESVCPCGSTCQWCIPRLRAAEQMLNNLRQFSIPKLDQYLKHFEEAEEIGVETAEESKPKNMDLCPSSSEPERQYELEPEKVLIAKQVTPTYEDQVEADKLGYAAFTVYEAVDDGVIKHYILEENRFINGSSAPEHERFDAQDLSENEEINVVDVEKMEDDAEPAVKNASEPKKTSSRKRKSTATTKGPEAKRGRGRPPVYPLPQDADTSDAKIRDRLTQKRSRVKQQDILNDKRAAVDLLLEKALTLPRRAGSVSETIDVLICSLSTVADLRKNKGDTSTPDEVRRIEGAKKSSGPIATYAAHSVRDTMTSEERKRARNRDSQARYRAARKLEIDGFAKMIEDMDALLSNLGFALTGNPVVAEMVKIIEKWSDVMPTKNKKAESIIPQISVF